MSKILLVDDGRVNLSVFRNLAGGESPAFEIIEVGSAAAAEQGAVDREPDCAAINIHLPDGSGVDLCRRLKGNPATAHLPLMLFATEDTDSNSRIAGLESGADVFLQAPWGEGDLVAHLKVLLRHKLWYDELRAGNRNLLASADACARMARLYQQQARFLARSTSSLVSCFELTPQMTLGSIIYVNDAFSRYLGYSEQEALRLCARDIIAAERRDTMPKSLAVLLQHNEVSIDSVLQGKDGQRVPVHTHGLVTQIEDAPVVIMIAESDATMEPLSEGEPRYQVVADYTGMILYERDLKSDKVKISGSVKRLTGYSPEDIMGLSFQQLIEMIHEEDRPQLVQHLADARDRLGKYQMEYRLHQSSGEYLYVEDTGVILPDEEGHPARLLGTVKDISHRKEAELNRRRMEREIEHSQKLESLGVLAGGIAHDFNNLLSAIIGLTDLSLSELPAGSSVHEDLTEALQAAHRAKDLVKQILAFSRQSGEERQQTYLHLIVREALKLLRATVPAPIKIVQDVDAGSGAIMANPGQMHQVVMNLATNGIHAMRGKGGQLQVRLEDIVLDAAHAGRHGRLDEGPYVRLTVTDSGHGMEPQVMERIFDPFFTTKGPGEGTGMGLSVVHGIVEDHGGVILVSSERGKGSAFQVYLPRIAMKEAQQPQPQHGHHGAGMVLLVDDEETLLRFGQKALPRFGYEVVICKSGEEALKLVREQPDLVDVVLTDQLMPGMSGTELAHELRKLRPTLPVIMYTGFSDQKIEEQARAAGIDEVLLKPLLARDMGAALRRVLDRARSV